jgi:acetyl-CoA carboxylase biotin carboxylase subunit
MKAALDEMVVLGIETNLDFQYKMIQTPTFMEGRADTGFVEVFMQGGHHS